MKKANRFIALFLAVLITFSSVGLTAEAAAIKDDVNTVEALIQGDNLGDLAGWLLTNINTRKEKITGTILRLVFMLVEDDEIKEHIGKTKLKTADDETLAKILVSWLNADVLPDLQEDIASEKAVQDLLKGFAIDVSSVDKLIATIHNLAITNTLGDISGLNESSLIVKRDPLIPQLNTLVTVKNSGNLGVVYAILQFLSDNTAFVKKLLEGKLNLGSLASLNSLINSEVKKSISPSAIKEMLIDAVELDKAPFVTGDVDEDEEVTASDARLILRCSVGLEPDLTETQLAAADCDGEEGVTAADARLALRASVDLDSLPEFKADYSSFTADEILAAAFLKLLTGRDSIEKEEAGAVMDLSIYGFLETYAGDIYANLLLDLLNNDARQLLNDFVAKDKSNTIKKVINVNYEFRPDTFDAYLGAGKGNMVAQLNNAVITLLEVILTKDAFKKLALEKGGNDKLNSNLTKTFRYILPIIKDIPDLGADLSGFTAAKVKKMSAEEMAVAVLKLFFKGWFKNANMKEVNKTVTLEQLAVLAAKYAATNDEWVPAEILAAAQVKNVEKLDDNACIELVYEIGMEVAAKALAHNKKTTYYSLPKNTKGWTGDDYLDDIVDWALDFVKGIPVIADTLNIKRGKTDEKGGFYKLNVVLNNLFDLSFIKGCGNEEFTVELETMIFDKFLGNLLNFDIEASVAILAENEEASIFNLKINEAAINLADDLLTALFEHVEIQEDSAEEETTEAA